MTDRLIVLFKGHSQYDSVNTMVEQLGAAFGRVGAPAVILDTRSASCVGEALALLRRGAVRLFVSLNGYGIPEEGAGFYAESPAPVLIYFVDHPAYHYPRIRAGLPRLIATFPTAHHVEFCRRFIRDDIPLHHLPHATAAADAAPWKERDIALFFSGSLLADPESFRAEWAGHGAEVAGRLGAIVAAHDAAPTRPLHEAVLAVLDGAEPPVEVLASYLITADTYLRSRVKRDLAQALAHLPLTLCGEGWARFAGELTRATLLPAMPAAATFAAMRRSRIVLNPLPPYYESHERPLQAMAHGAVAANGPSGMMAAAFPGAYLPLPAGPQEAAAVIEAALADSALLQSIAGIGHNACLAGHLWDHRAAEILRLAGL